MKKKSVIAIASIFLNLVLLSALAHYNKINSEPTNSPAPFFRLQHLSAIGYSQNASKVIVLASTMK